MSGRLDTFFAEQAGGLCHTDYWARLAEIWRTASPEERGDERWDGIWEQARVAPGSDRGLMTDEELAVYEALPAGERATAVALFLVDGRAHPVP